MKTCPQVIALALVVAMLPMVAAALTPSTTTLVSSPNPSMFGQAVTLTATVSPATASGKVTFYDREVTLAIRAPEPEKDYTLPMGTRTLMTMEQFLQLPDEESHLYELWQGELVYVGETIFDHNWTRDELLFSIKTFLQNARLGGEALAETGIQFDTNTLARPDLSYWDAEHLASIDRKGSPVQIIPQWLAEVVSPSNSLARLFRNAEYFLRAGVQVVWVIDFDPFEIHVFEQGKGKRVLRSGDMLEAPSVLPGFSENVSRFVPPAK